MDRETNGVLLMIPDMRKTYTEYLDEVNKVDNQHNQIQTR